MINLLKSNRGEADVSTIIIIGGIIFVVTMMVVLGAAMKLDDVAQESVLKYCSDFVNTSANEGKITKENYDNFIDSIHSTGHSYNVSIEVQHKDENIGNKSAWTSSNATGEAKYVYSYTSEIEEGLKKDGKYLMKEGDRISVSVENTDKGLRQQVTEAFSAGTGNGTAVVSGSGSATVKVNGN